MLKQFFAAGLICGMGVTTVLPAGEPLFPTVHKKIIEFSGDNPTPEYLDSNLEQIEMYVPHDGIGIDIIKKITLSNGKKVLNEWHNFSKVRFRLEWYEADIEHLKKVHARAKRLKYNFLNTSASSFTGEFNLYDDEFWDIVCEMFGIFARVAKQGGCAGIRFDLEDYGNQQVWRYRPARDRSWDEAWEKARARGRQWMNAIAREYPEITIFLFFSLDLMLGEADGSAYMYQRLSRNRSGLLAAFFNGIYDALPSKAKIVDGMEGYGYGAYDLSCYHLMRAVRNERFPQFLSPENRLKFQKQGSLACAIYPKYYYDKKSRLQKYIENEGVTPVEFFRRNFAWAVQYSDEYVWTWSSHRKWFPMKFRYAWLEKKLKGCPDVPGPYMGMALPGVEDAIRYARDPWKYAMDRLKNESFRNLVKNPGFEGAVSDQSNVRAPDSKQIQGFQPWYSWQKDKSKGTYSLAKGEGINGSNALLAKGVSRGCAMQTVKIAPYSLYVVRACAKTTGKCCVSLIIQWKNQKGAWCSTLMNVAAPFDEDLGNGWKRATLVLRNVPEEARYLSPMLYSYADSSDAAVLFDNVEVFNIFEKKTSVAPHLRDAMEQWKKSASVLEKENKKNIEKQKRGKMSGEKI